MTQIIFIRHGMTDWNYQRRAQGQSDIPLNEEGRNQARQLASRLKEDMWDLIFSSDLSRASETASIVAESIGLVVQTDRRLREMHKGVTEGTTLEERISKWGEQWESLSLGIEKDESIIQRGSSFVSELLRNYSDKRILVVSHGALIGLTIKYFIPDINIDIHFGNTSITKLNFINDEWECNLINCTSHIEDYANGIL
ncbi:putative phosphoglycerate mutase [Paenibacillus endophyticus]|uniref:Putative phosphoglycerate mutase n=1 Tax=Paenibacillus endophyticus TaxID=1294268 RepID=A0A7W5CCR8_9BACL|nr:histidine phosphatase family protein [Paenibacillus endophyticus]MBB3155343.1 putative phosphoglycerate mutase [Paenibacillus endophyticus]